MLSDMACFRWRIIVRVETQLIDSAEYLWASDVSVNKLIGASQFDVSSLYDDDAEQQQSATTSSKRFDEPLSAEDLHVVPQKYRQWRDVCGHSFRRLAC